MSVFTAQVLPPVDFGQVPLWRQILRGFSQCAFQANEVTALFFIAAVAWYDLKFAGYYIIGVVVGTIVAKVIGGVPDLLDLGLYGFNSGLMGLALGTFYVYTPALWLLVPVMAAIVAAFAVMMSKTANFPFIAAPFIITFWIFFAFGGYFGLEAFPNAPFTDTEVHWVVATFEAAGGAVFANAVFSGVLFLFGILISNWRHAIIALFAVSIAHWIAFEGQVHPGLINNGLVGFNAILCAIAVYSLVSADLRLALLGAIGATLLIRVFSEMGLIPLAAGFVTMTWLIILLAWINTWFNPKEEPSAEEAALNPA